MVDEANCCVCKLGMREKSDVSSLDFRKNVAIGMTTKWIGILSPSYRPPTSPSQSRKLYVERSIVVFSCSSSIQKEFSFLLTGFSLVGHVLKDEEPLSPSLT